MDNIEFTYDSTPQRIHTSEGEVVVVKGSNSLQFERWLALKCNSSFVRQIQHGSIKLDLDNEEKLYKQFENQFFEELNNDGYSLVVRRHKAHFYKDYKNNLVDKWISMQDDNQFKRKEEREIESNRIARRSLYISIASFIFSIVALATGFFR